MIRRIDAKKRTLVVDGSLFVYRIATALEEPTRWEDDIWTLHADAKLGKRVIDTTLGNYKTKLNCDKIIIAEDHKDNFRHSLYPEYKSHRKKVRKPIIVKPLKEYLKENYESVSLPGLEGDDVCGILATKPGNKDKIVVLSGDKDMRTIPGIHHFIHDDSTEVVDEKTANYNFMYQTLVGDLTDGFGGCPTIGGVKASRVLANKKDLPEMWEAVVAEYEKQKLDKKYALTQARLARILRASDWDSKKEKPILWKM
ncbi:hypothetical protein [Candidatus Pelagibacter communis]|jgi:DNA polymerase-1|uniref:hypothetical protein n=1 Tax=Pelagibacter ubique TaxID=198252 RepID=UPI00094D5141|nr:hypothetical protein [Candidatus Pelagibacter ubique]|tara:strand:- start:714 stop:1478 length:765 start_codon:yes stop_codon:yes gene_type:complete